jgi:hypothetical protein
MAAAGALAFTAFAGEAWAIEGNTPYLAGVSIGIPTGALPPPGFYASDDNVIISGGLRNDSGNNVPVNANAYLNIPSVLWAPTWQPLSGMGATIAFDAVLPYVQQSFNVSSPGFPSTAAAFFNPIIGANVGWNFAPFFFKVGLGIYLPTGNWQDGIANNTTTFEPDLALSWLSNGWNLTAHAVFDFQTEDGNAQRVLTVPGKYQSGNLFFLDLTAGKSFGKWTFGGGANYSQQMNNDHLSDTLACNGVTISSCDTPAVPGVRGVGNVHQRVLIGPYMGYNFGPAEVNAKILYTVHAENAFQSSFYHIGFSFPF